MKKLFIPLLLAGALLACKNQQHPKNWNHINPATEDHAHELVSEKLELNNGAKWKVDRITNNNIENLKAIIKEFNEGQDKSLKAYKKVGGDVQNGLAKMISECKMKGPGHMALHKWLEPLMEDVAKLKQATTDTMASRSFEVVHLHLNRYDQYFE